jgi:hemolysin activation/secretion protein
VVAFASGGVIRKIVRPLPMVMAAFLPMPLRAQPLPLLPGVIERVAPPPSPRAGPLLAPPEPMAATGPGAEQRVPLGAVAITGSSLPRLGLAALVAGLAGRDATLAEIEAARLALLRAYREAGFPYVAVAAQLGAGWAGRADLTFRITEGEVVALRLEGEIGPAARQVARFTEGLVGQRPLSQPALERALLLANDIPGVTARGLLRPAEGAPGGLDLVVQLERRGLGGFVTLDNRGQAQTGAWQALAVLQANALTAWGDRAELALLGTDTNGQRFAQAAYEAFLGGSGLRIRAQAGVGRATPGSALAALGYAGDTQTAGLALSYPVLRSRALTVQLAAQMDALDSLVEIETGGQRTRVSRDAVRAGRLGLELTGQDAWLSGPAAAVSTLHLRAHRGIESLGASTGGSARAGADFGFFRATIEASRLQPLLDIAPGWMLSAHALGAVQWSDHVLPSAERFQLGGNRLGRGFFAGQAAGDRAVAGTLELRLDTPRIGAAAIGTQLFLFHDRGQGFGNAPGDSARRLSSWGGGIRTQIGEAAQLEVEGVHRATRTPQQGGEGLSDQALFIRLLLRF